MTPKKIPESCNLVYEDYEWNNVPITTQYATGGVYLVPTNSGYDVSKAGYVPVGIMLTNFQSAYKDAVIPVIVTSVNKVLFFSKTSQTLGVAYFRVLYMKA